MLQGPRPKRWPSMETARGLPSSSPRMRRHPGIVGLIAARLKEEFKRPGLRHRLRSLEQGTGSGRSIDGFDMGRMVRAAVEKDCL